MIILGIGGIRNDAACVLLKDGVIVSAVEQRKVARMHRTGAIPDEAIRACLEIAKCDRASVDTVALVRPIGGGQENTTHIKLRDSFANAQVILMDHHAAHAASAYYASPFDEATVLTIDRQGDLRCGALWSGKGRVLEIERELYVPDSPADVYSRVTALLGYEPNADEHKVQWLSTSGDDRFVGLFEDILGSGSSGWPRIDRGYFDSHRHGSGEFSAKFYKRIGIDDGEAIPHSLRQHIAAGVQRAVERTVAAMAGEGGGDLALAGGLFLNALLVASLERSGRWRRVFVQPAAGNSGTAIGAALYAWHGAHRREERAALESLFLGPGYPAEDIKKVFENCKLRFKYLLTTGELIQTAVEELNDHKIIAWMHGRMEFGPRALGNRSILASPLNEYSTQNLNEFIKHREPFRKFAASVPEELADEYFETGANGRFLSTAGRVRPAHRKTFEAAILGADFVRVHLVRKEDNPLYWELLHAFGKATGLPVLYNTSFNLFGDPLVCSPRDAVRSFYSSGIDSLFAGGFLLRK